MLPGTVAAHGSVTPDEDLCLIRIGYYSAHFKIYLPESHGHRQFCEDLPAAGPSLFVMEYIHDGLADAPIEFRIIRNVTGQGQFTRLQHIEALGDLGPHTVFLHAAAIQRDVFTVLHDFSERGEFVGIVSAPAASGGALHTAVFPFAAGTSRLGMWPWLALAAVLLQLNFLWMSGWFEQRSWRGLLPRAWFPSLLAAAIFPLVAATAIAAEPAVPESLVSEKGYYLLSVSSELDPPTINRMHSWTLTLSHADGQPVDSARITVSGGMPAHDHGLPTNPRVTRELGDGRYLLEGMRFHMHGRWQLLFVVDGPAGTDQVVLDIDL